MVIMKYTPSSTSAAGTADFWINPTSATLSTTPNISFATGGVIGDVSFVTLKTGLGAADVLMDELHISTSWTDVAPSVSTKLENYTSKQIGLSTTILRNQVSLTNCNENASVEFYTIDSKLVKSFFVNGENSMNVSDLKKGIYVVKINSATQKSVFKAIKE
jgi:hypothetical protein